MNALILIAMVLCLVVVFVTANGWMGEMIACFLGDEEESDPAAGMLLVFFCLVAGLGYSWLSFFFWF